MYIICIIFIFYSLYVLKQYEENNSLSYFVMTHPTVQVVSALLEAPSSLSSPSPVDTELRDSYGMTALFHTCNHGHHRY